MIQRIQSLFLVLAIVALGLMAFFPIASFYSDTGVYILDIFGLNSITPGNEVPFVGWFFLPLGAVAVVIIVLDAVTLFSYKHRLRQIKILQGTILLNILLIVAIMFYYVPAIEESTGTMVDYQNSIGIYLPLISLVFSLLAQHYIKKDEKLVRSVDRLR